MLWFVADVIQIRRARDMWAGIARNRAQVGVDRQEIAISHIFKSRPRHDLEKIRIERKGQAVRRLAGRSAARMNVIEIRSLSDNLDEFSIRVAAFWQSGVIRRQVAAVEVWNAARPTGERTEIVTAAQVEGRVNLYRSTERRR